MKEVATLFTEIYNSDSLQEFSAEMLDKGLESLVESTEMIPVFGSICKLKNIFYSYKDYQLSKKIVKFLFHIKDIDLTERYKIVGEIETLNGDKFASILLTIIDRLDNINKVEILSNLLKAKVHEEISIEDFLSLSSALENIPFIYLNKLLLYMTDRYHPGESERLSGVGIVTMRVLDANTGMKYRLNDAGVMLVKYGLKKDVTTPEGRNLDVSVNPEWNEVNDPEV